MKSGDLFIIFASFVFYLCMDSYAYLVLVALIDRIGWQPE